MSRKCEITGKKVMSGNNFPKSSHKTKRKFLPNLQKKKVLIDGKPATMKMSTTGIRTLKKKGEVTLKNGKKISLKQTTPAAPATK